MRKLEKKLKIDCNELQVELPWKDKDGNHRYDSFIPEVERPVTADNVELSEPQSGEKRKRLARRPTDKGALYHDYSRDVHEWLTRLRRVHFNNPPATINGPGKVIRPQFHWHRLVKAYTMIKARLPIIICSSPSSGMRLSSRPGPLVCCVHFTSSARQRTLKTA